MVDPHPTLTDSTVTLGDDELAVSSIAFTTDTVELRRDDWDEAVIERVQDHFADSDTPILTITLPDRRFELPVEAPTIRRQLDREGASIVLTFDVPKMGYLKSHIPTEAPQFS